MCMGHLDKVESIEAWAKCQLRPRACIGIAVEYRFWAIHLQVVKAFLWKITSGSMCTSQHWIIFKWYWTQMWTNPEEGCWAGTSDSTIHPHRKFWWRRTEPAAISVNVYSDLLPDSMVTVKGEYWFLHSKLKGMDHCIIVQLIKICRYCFSSWPLFRWQ